MGIGLAILVDQHSAQGTDLLRDQRAEDLTGIGNAGGVILDGILIQQLCAGAVAQDQAVSSGAVVVGGGEILIVQPTCTAGGDDHGLGPGHQVVTGLHIQQDSAGHLALVVLDQLHSGGELHHGDLPVDDLIPDGTHDLCAGVVLAGVHTLTGGAAAMGGDHGAVLILVKHNAQLIQPLDGIGRFHDQTAQQLGTSGEVAAAEGVQVVLHGAVIGLVGGLDATFSHHGVGITDTQLGDDHHIGAGLVGLDGCGAACAAAADDQHIHIIFDLAQIDILIQQAAVGVEQIRQLHGRFLTLVGSDLDLLEALSPVVGVVGLQQLTLFLRGHTTGFYGHTGSTGGFHFLNGFQHFRCKHGFPLLTSRCPGGYTVPASR